MNTGYLYIWDQRWLFSYLCKRVFSLSLHEQNSLSKPGKETTKPPYICEHQTHVAKMNVVRGMARCPEGFWQGGAEALEGGDPLKGSPRGEIFHLRRVRGVYTLLCENRGHHGEFQIQMKGQDCRKASCWWASPQERNYHQNDYVTGANCSLSASSSHNPPEEDSFSVNPHLSLGLW